MNTRLNKSRRYFLGMGVRAMAMASLSSHATFAELASSLASLRIAPPQIDSPGGEMIVYSQKFLTTEMPMAALTSWITPVEKFFVRNNLLMPPAIDVGKWELRLAGEVRKPLTLNFSDLAGMPKFKVTNTIECAGNGRAFYNPRIGGVPWRRGAVGNAVFEGPRLRDVLQKAGLTPGARHVAFAGLDTPPAGAERFIRSIPLEKALDENTLIATHINGAPLTMPHGFPARALVPGWIGSASIKWLQEITVLSHEYQGAFMDPGYRVPAVSSGDGQNHPGEERRTVPLTSLRLKSIISNPSEDAALNFAEGLAVNIRGAAWAGEKSVAAVEISTDGGKIWRKSVVTPEHAKYAWRLWAYDWAPAAPGTYEVMSRALDADGNRQPIKPLWNDGGYLWNGVDHITVKVQA